MTTETLNTSTAWVNARKSRIRERAEVFNKFIKFAQEQLRSDEELPFRQNRRRIITTIAVFESQFDIAIQQLAALTTLASQGEMTEEDATAQFKKETDDINARVYRRRKRSKLG